MRTIASFTDSSSLSTKHLENLDDILIAREHLRLLDCIGQGT